MSEAGNSETPQANKLTGLLEYQTGAIVSRALLKTKGGSVTLFAFAEGEGLSEHTAPFDALVMVLEGNADVQIAGKHAAVEPGEVIILPANQPHAVRAVTNFKMLLVMIRAS